MYKVVGLGDSGIVIVNNIAKQRLETIETIVINTHLATVTDSLADHNLLLNNSGFGAAGNPMMGKEAAEASKDMLFDALGYAKRIYITCGMGGGTGSGAAHVVAYVAKELRIPTIAVVSMPFSFEGSRRKKIAELGVKALSHFVDEMILVDTATFIETPAFDFLKIQGISLKVAFSRLSMFMAAQILIHIANDSSAAQS